MVSQEFPFPGKLKLKGEMAQREADAEFQQYQAASLGVVSRLKQAYYRLWYTYAAADVLARNRDIFAKMLKVAEIRYTAGKVPQQDVLRSQTELSILETRLVKLEQERAALAAQINALLNRKTGAPLGRPEEVTAAPFSVTVDKLLDSARANAPMLRRERSMVQRSELAVNMARKEYYPDFGITAGYFNMGSMPPMYEFRGEFKVPLYFWRKQRAGVAEQSSRLVEARRNYESAGENLEARIREDYSMAQASARLMELYRKTVVPQASLTLESALNTYQTGANDLTTVLASASTILEYEMSYYDELRDYSLALARLEEMTAVPLTM
jgi:outer membrane protein TolC